MEEKEEEERVGETTNTDMKLNPFRCCCVTFLCGAADFDTFSPAGFVNSATLQTLTRCDNVAREHEVPHVYPVIKGHHVTPPLLVTMGRKMIQKAALVALHSGLLLF